MHKFYLIPQKGVKNTVNMKNDKKLTIMGSILIGCAFFTLLYARHQQEKADVLECIESVHLPRTQQSPWDPNSLNKEHRIVFAVLLIDIVGDSNADEREYKIRSFEQLKKTIATESCAQDFKNAVTQLIDKRVDELNNPTPLIDQLARALQEAVDENERGGAHENRPEDIESRLRSFGIEFHEMRNEAGCYLDSISSIKSPLPIWESAASLNFSELQQSTNGPAR